MRKHLVVGFVVFAMCTPPAWAARTRVHEAAESSEYGRKFGGMIGRGALNVVTCFVDLLVNVVNETKAGPPVVGTMVGLGRGTSCAGLRLLSGGVDLVTFWVPSLKTCAESSTISNRPRRPISSESSLRRRKRHEVGSHDVSQSGSRT